MRDQMKLVTFILYILIIFSSMSFGAEGDDFIPEQVMCQVLPPYSIDSVNETYSTTLLAYLPELNIYLLQTQAGENAETLAELIELEPGVVFCQANYIMDTPEGVQSSQPFLDELSAGDIFSQPAATTLSIDPTNQVSNGTGVKVGVIDAGIDTSNPALAARVTSGFDFVSNDSIANDEPGGIASGHGTFVAGIVNLMAPESELLAYRVLDTTGRGNGFTISEAILQAIDKGCKVINLSMVMNKNHASIDMAIEYAKDNNVIVVAAAGNDSLDFERFPARDSYTLSVAALDSNNVLADFSNYNGKVDVCAPGTQIYSSYLGSDFAWWDGTSFAAPFVAAQAALLFSLNPEATWNDVMDAITLTAINIDSINPGLEGKLGFGLIDPLASVELFSNLMCGDINGNNEVNISDVAYMVSYLFGGGPSPFPMSAGDVNCNGEGNISDITYMVAYLFGIPTGPPPCQACP